jgi:hypothetical protein
LFIKVVNNVSEAAGTAKVWKRLYIDIQSLNPSSNSLKTWLTMRGKEIKCWEQDQDSRRFRQARFCCFSGALGLCFAFQLGLIVAVLARAFAMMWWR